jgi:hypothetical protein
MSDDKEFQIQRLGSALEVSGNTIRSLENKLNTCQMIIQRMEADKQQWEQQKVLQEKIIKQQIESMEVEKRSLQQEVMELRAKLKAA